MSIFYTTLIAARYRDVWSKYITRNFLGLIELCSCYTNGMNPDEQQWQPPKQAQPQAPYQATEEPSREEQPVSVEPDIYHEQEIQEPVVSPSEQEEDGDEEALLQWDAPEYLSHTRSTGWYIGFGTVSVILMAIALFLMRSVTFAVLIPIMAVAFILYIRSKPSNLRYVLSKKGLHVNDKLFPYTDYRSFSVITMPTDNILQLMPRKRFRMGQIAHFPTEVGEALVDVLAARLPMKEGERDLYDKITTKLKM